MSNKRITVSTDTRVKNAGALWTVSVLTLVFLISMTLSFISSEFIPSMPLWTSFLLLIGMILINILFDIIGIAVATSAEVPFHSMSARRVAGASQAIWLIHNAEKVSNVCCDVIGDIAGIISGVAASTMALRLIMENNSGAGWFSLGITSLVAALTVGGKSIGKNIALAHSNQIVYIVAKFFSIFGFAAKKKR